MLPRSRELLDQGQADFLEGPDHKLMPLVLPPHFLEIGVFADSKALGVGPKPRHDAEKGHPAAGDLGVGKIQPAGLRRGRRDILLPVDLGRLAGCGLVGSGADVRLDLDFRLNRTRRKGKEASRAQRRRST